MVGPCPRIAPSQADEAAEALLRRLQPSLCNRGALVNVGTLVLQVLEPSQQAAAGSAGAQLPTPALGPHRSPNTSGAPRQPTGRLVQDDGDW